MDGHRVAKTSKLSKGIKLGIAAASLAVVGIASAYLGLCSWVGSSSTILPNVSLSGVDVSGMTRDQARTALDQAVEQYGADATVTLSCDSWSGTLSAADLLRDSNVCAAVALGEGRGSFLSQGYQFLRHLAGASSQVKLSSGVVHLAQPALDALLEQADRQIGGSVRQNAWTVENDAVTVTKGKTGTSFDRDGVLLAAAEAADQALEAAVTQGQAVNVPVDLSRREDLLKTAPPEVPDFEALHREVYVQEKSAQLDPETNEVTDHVVGLDFDVQALEAAYAAAAEGETVSVPLAVTQPAETKDSLVSKLFQDILGQATSKLDNNANRTHNVKLAAAACNGKILLPGEIFSYNDTTGSRDASMGYLPSTIYVSGRTEVGVGGGVCQPSSTIYYALLHTTLEVVERHDHQFAVGYVPDGMDATVYYGSLDFRFQNNTDYPIKIVTECYEKNGSTYMTATLYGTNTTGRYAKPESAVYDWVSPTDSYQADESVPRGTLVLDREQNAYTGRKATTYRYIYEADGTLVEKQNMGSSKYAMRPRLYHYNPLDGDPSTWVDGKPPAQNQTPQEPVQQPSQTPAEEQPSVPEVPQDQPQEEPQEEQPPAVTEPLAPEGAGGEEPEAAV